MGIEDKEIKSRSYLRRNGYEAPIVNEGEERHVFTPSTA